MDQEVLTIIESPPSPAAVVALRAAIRRHGRALHAEAGPEALAAVLTRIRADAADRALAAEHERTVREARDSIGQEAAA